MPDGSIKSKYLGKTRELARNEVLRAPNPDIDAIAIEYGLGAKAVGIIKDLISKHYGLVRICERNDATMGTVVKWARILDPYRKGKNITRIIEGKIIRSAILAHATTSDSTSELIGTVSRGRLAYHREKLQSSGLLSKADRKARREALTFEERRAIINDLWQEPRPTKKVLMEKYKIGENTPRFIAYDNWIPTNASEEAFDVSLFLTAAREITEQHLANSPETLQNEINLTAEQSGWISQIEGMKPWPNTEGFRTVDALLTYYLHQSGISGPEELQQRTVGGRRAVLTMPNDIYLALHFALAGRLAILNRRTVYLRSDSGAPGPTPSRPQLEEMTDSIIRQLRTVFPTLVSFIPADTLRSTDSLWERLKRYRPNKDQFEKELQDLLSTKQICNYACLKVKALPMIFVLEFGYGKSVAQIFDQPEFLEQLEKLEVLRGKSIRFARLMEEHSTNLPKRSTRIIDRVILAKWVDKLPLDKSVKDNILSFYSKPPTACPVVNGALTPAALYVMEKMAIPIAKVKEIFESELAEVPEQPVSRSRHRRVVANPDPSA